MSERSVPRTRIISRDTLTWLFGLGLMAYQGTLPTPEFNLWAFAGGMVISGVPMALQGAALITGRTAGPSLPSPEPPSSPEPSTPSSSGV